MGSCGLQGIKKHGRGIAASFGLDDFGSRALAPNFELLDGGGAERIRGAQQHRLALRAKHLRQFADGGGFASAVHAHHHDHFRCALHPGQGLRSGRGQNRQQFLFKQAFEFIHVLDLPAVRLVAEFFKNFMGGSGAEVGANQGGFEIVEGGAVDLLADGDDVLDALGQVLAGARDRLLHALNKTRFPLFVQTAKKGLNHRERL